MKKSFVLTPFNMQTHCQKAAKSTTEEPALPQPTPNMRSNSATEVNVPLQSGPKNLSSSCQKRLNTLTAQRKRGSTATQKSQRATPTVMTGMQGAPSQSQTGLSASVALPFPVALSCPVAPSSPAAPLSPLAELLLIQGKSGASPATPTPTGALGQSTGSRRTTQWLPLTTSRPKVI